MITMEGKCISPIWSLFLLVILYTLHVDCVAVMSVDVGTEWMKVAIVSPGVPMEIALNKESKRKTPVAIAFRDNERTFGEDALNVGVRFPSLCYSYFLDLLGKDINNPAVKKFQENFPYYNLVPDHVRNTVLFKHDNETYFSPEELVAMMLTKAREFAVDSARQPVNDVVLTVPGYFNQVERKSMIIAAEMAGLKVLQLINDYTAAALNYGIYRRKDFNETAQYVMLYDMGAYTTSAVVVSYQTVKTKEKGYAETNPQLSILGVGYDRTLGGLEMQLRLRDYIANKFNEMKKTEKNVFKNPRSLAKLFKEAGRLKIILSANQEYYAQVEGLIDEIDFKLLVTREEFEGLCGDLFDRVKMPLEKALNKSQLSLDVVSQIILVGAGTRVPAVQEKLTAAIKTELSKNLNTDEAAVLGAAYKAADLSTAFKVKKFVTKDAVLFPIQVTFERGDTDKESKQITRTLFNHMNPYPQKKILTFNKHKNDFEFLVQYGDLESAFPEHEIKTIGPKVLNKIKLKGVSDAIKKHQGPNAESKGIKAHFHLDESGLLSMTNVEYYVEKTFTPEELAAQEADGQSTFSKLSHTISKLFQGAEDELGEKKADPEVKSNEQKEEEEPLKENVKPVKEESEAEAKQNETEKAENKTEPDPKTENATAKEPVEKKPKIVVLKEPVGSEIDNLVVPHLSGENLQKAIEKINALNEYDIKKNRREGALNSLESAVIDSRSKMEDEDFSNFAKAAEVESVNTKTQQIADWLDEDGYGAEADVLEQKLSELNTLLKPIQYRYKEHIDRPEAMKAFENTINSSKSFLDSMKHFSEKLNATTDDPKYTLYTKVEIASLEKLIKDSVAWKETTVEQQQALPKSDDPVLNLRAISERKAMLDREIGYLANKSKTWKPPPIDKTKGKEKKEEGHDKDTTTGEEKPSKDQEKEPETETVQEPQQQEQIKSTGAEVKEDAHTEL